ncbi:hypothetical protein [Companilactobacillus kimchiensis]|nr:hypothetical protein [Companilactobacillus kimchiensis]
MLKFGKRVSYRPLIISLLIGLIAGYPTADVLNSGLYGLGVGFVFFCIVFFGYYFLNVPILFVYWDVNSDGIRYYDVDKWNNRLLSMLVPPLSKYTTINKNSIKSITFIGDLDNRFEIPMALPYTAAVGVFTGAISMAHHPDFVRLNLIDGSTVNMSIARDYTYSRNKTIDKLNLLLKVLGQE